MGLLFLEDTQGNSQHSFLLFNCSNSWKLEWGPVSPCLLRPSTWCLLLRDLRSCFVEQSLASPSVERLTNASMAVADWGPAAQGLTCPESLIVLWLRCNTHGPGLGPGWISSTTELDAGAAGEWVCQGCGSRVSIKGPRQRWVQRGLGQEGVQKVRQEGAKRECWWSGENPATAEEWQPQPKWARMLRLTDLRLFPIPRGRGRRTGCSACCRRSCLTGRASGFRRPWCLLGEKVAGPVGAKQACSLQLP